jgi:arylsulfatase A-like enzyme
MGDAWVQTLRDRPKHMPFFLWAAHYDPHRGYQRGAVDPPHTRDDVVVPPFFPDHPEVRDDLALYYDEISRFDQHIGMTIDELRRQGVAENTFVLVMSDNGRPFPHCKTRVDVPGVRTPLIVHWPRGVRFPGQSIRQVISSIDIAPTVLELAGLKPLESFQGRSFAPLLAGAKIFTRRYAFAEHNWHDYRAFERAVHDRQFCYVRNWLPDAPGTPPADAVRSPTYAVMKQLHAEGKLTPPQQGCFETPRPEEFLFDVESDPDCRTNLAPDPRHAGVLESMRAALGTWQDETDDVFPGKQNLTPDGFDRSTGERLINAAHPRQAE